MKKTLLACFLVAAGFFLGAPENAYSQTATVSWGPTLKEPRKTATSGIVGSDPTGFYTLRSDFSGISLFSFNRNPESMFLERYDKENRLVFSKELIIPASAKANGKFKFEGLYYLHGQLVLFSSFLDKDNGRNTAFANKVSPDGVVNNQTVEVASFGDATKRNSGSFNFVLSNDSSKVMVFENLPDEKRQNETFQFRVLDNSLSILTNKTITLPSMDKDTGLNDFRVDNDGNVYVLLSTNKKREDRKFKEQKFTYRIFGYFAKEDKVKEYEIRIPTKYITDLTFDLDKNKNLLVAGFYADDAKLRASGTFFLRVAYDTKAILTQSVKDFTPEFLQMFMSKTKAKNKNAGVAYMDLDKLIIREDGGVLLVSEVEHWYVVTVNNGRNTTTVYHYENHDIVFVNINPNGNIDWISRVPKRQHTVNDGGAYNSYSVNVMGDKIYLVFNDNVKNLKHLEPRKMKVMSKPKKAVTMLVTLDNTGNFRKQALFPAHDAKTIVRPAFYFQNDKNVIIYSETGRDYRFGNISFN